MHNNRYQIISLRTSERRSISSSVSHKQKTQMAEDKPRLARLTAIMTQLQSKRIVTARDIAEKHNVSIRTVYRDIRTLEKSGIPIITEEGKGYSIMEGYKLSLIHI